MKWRVFAVSAIAVVGIAASSASAFDRQPLRLTGLRPDGWHQSITNAERALRARYRGIARDYCVGAIMVGYEGDSSFVHGTTRYWDKLVCAGKTVGEAVFILVFDQKGRNAWVIYRLKGVSVAALEGLS